MYELRYNFSRLPIISVRKIFRKEKLYFRKDRKKIWKVMNLLENLIKEVNN